MVVKPKDHKLVRIDSKLGITLISQDNSKILNDNRTVTIDTLIVYVLQFDNGTYKLGQLLEEADNSKYLGMLPETIWQESYLAQTRAMGSGVVLKHLFLFSKTEWLSKKTNKLIDDSLRGLVRKKYNDPRVTRKIPFSANLHIAHTTEEFRNKENLVGYDHNNLIHFEILKNISKELVGVEQDAVDAIKFIERIYQTGDVALITKLLKKYRLVLLNAYTSYGKTMISTAIMIRVLEDQGGGFAIVTTPRTDTLGDFETNPTKFDFGSRKLPIVIRQSEIKQWPVSKIQKHVQQGYVVILLASVQGVRHKGKVDENKKEFSHEKFKRYKKYFEICDIWIRDEKWTEYGGAKTAKLMKQLEGNMMILDLAATSAKIKDDYNPNAIVDRSLFWAMKNRKLTQLPELMIDGVYWPALKVIDKLADVYIDEENFHPEKLFVGNASSTDFANLSVVESLPEYFYRENALAKKLGISVIDDPDLTAISKRVGICVLPEGNKDWPADLYMPKLSKLWNNLYGDKELYISAYELEKLVKKEGYETTNDCIKNLLNTHERVVILTHRKYTVGTSIDNLGHIILLDSISSDDLFEQLVGRILRLILVGETNIKTLVKVKALVPNLQLKSTLAKMAVEHSDKTETNSDAKEYFDLLGLKAYDASGKPVSVSGEDVVDEIAKQRLAISGSGLKPTEVQEYLSDSKTVKAWQNANLPKIKINSKGTLQLTEDNGSKTKNSNGKKQNQKQNNFSEEQIRKIMNEVFGMVKVVAYCNEDK